MGTRVSKYYESTVSMVELTYLSMTECTVLNSVDQASLWKHMITDVAGRFEPNRPGSLHLSDNESLSILPTMGTRVAGHNLPFIPGVRQGSVQGY